MRHLLFLLAISICFPVCKKGSDNLNSPFQLLTNGSWRVIEETWNPSNTGWVDSYPGIPTCLKDNTVAYRSDLVSVDDEGQTKCNSSDPQTTLGSWRLYAGDTKFSVTRNGTTTEYEIVELTQQTLKVYFKISNAPFAEEYKVTLVH